MGANSGFGSLSPRISLTTKSNATVTNRYRFAEVNSKAVGFYSNATSQTAETKRTGTTPRLMKEPSTHSDETPRGTLQAFMNGAATHQLSPYEAHHSSVMNVTARGGREGNATSTPVFVMLPLDTARNDPYPLERTATPCRTVCRLTWRDPLPITDLPGFTRRSGISSEAV